MQIDRIFFPVKTLGYGERIGIWTQGCVHHCTGCSNPELWDKAPEKEVSIQRIIEHVQSIGRADGVTITGGDPFLQSSELARLVRELKRAGLDDILVYTGYLFEELKEKGEDETYILKNIAVLIDGPYVDSLNDNKSIRGSSNQRIIILNQKYAARYDGAIDWKRETQIINNNNYIQAIGLPLKKYDNIGQGSV